MGKACFLVCLAILLANAETLVGRALLAQKTCPPPGFSSAQPFNLLSFIDGPWYVQKQVTTTYTPENFLYCVRANYIPIAGPGDLSKGVFVNNYSNKDRVNGMAATTSKSQGGLQLYATVPNATVPSQLQVGPYFGDNGVTTAVSSVSIKMSGQAANYWVVATDSSSSDPLFAGYEWAIITTRPPTIPSGDGCRTGSADGGIADVAQRGFWWFTRQQEAPAAALEALRKKSLELGLDIGVLEDVKQEGCDYSGAP
ncbi:hypothetical protein WJX75_004014 [Coccomyxa subellipsoidea]|uniref:Lipocalin/cytosolic fatty-acid binding domain-containing protein n=1 Tax=Coccomyxa subellipsoidea TaxID=248742 RepID=A0ABR2Z2N2_9CHLO